MPRKLKAVQRVAGELRTVILEHASVEGSARITRVETGGVDRETGEALRVYFEVTVTGFRKPMATRLFSGQGNPRIAEYNARVAYLLAQYGIIDDYSLPIGAITGPRLWEEPRNMTKLEALSACRRVLPAPRTRMNTGDFDAELRPTLGGCPGGRESPETTPNDPDIPG